MKPPCVIMVTLVLPSVRAIIAKKLVDEYGLRKAEAVERVQLTRAAITQYYKGVRGSSNMKILDESKASRTLISDIAQDLASGERDILQILEKLCKLCRILRRSRLLCRFCQEMMPKLEISRCNLCR